MAAVAKDIASLPTESLHKRKQQRLAELKAERNSWDPHYRDLQEHFLTRRGRWITDSKQRGDKRNQKLIDPTPKFAARTLGAGMHAGSTNPATPWFRLTTPDPEMMELPSVSLWLYAVENRMRDVFARTNLYSVLPTTYMEAGVFGTAPILMLEHPRKVIHFVPKTVGSYYLASNSDGAIDTMYCEYKMSLRNLVADFGVNRLSDGARAQYLAGKRDELVDVLHTIEPNPSRDVERLDAQSMAFQSAYFESQGTIERPPLRISGFEDNPLAVFRWETTEITDPYGSSCGMDALGCAKAMQLQQRRKAQAIDKLVDPPMVGDPAMKNQASTLLPGDVTWAGFTPTGSAPKFQPAYTIKPELQGLILDIQDVRELCEIAMYTDLFFAITRADPRNATVPEIDARKEEQILALGPVLQNHTDGLIKPIIDRTFNAMVRNSRPVWEGVMSYPMNPAAFIPPPPPELENVPLRIEMIGALAQAFRSIAGGKLERFVGFIGSVAKAQIEAGQPADALDKFDADQTVDEYAQAIGVPPTVVRSDDDVAAIRQQRAEAQQAQAAAAAAQPVKDMATAAKSLSETQMGTGSALDMVAEEVA
jgi:hypothetical protein